MNLSMVPCSSVTATVTFSKYCDVLLRQFLGESCSAMVVSLQVGEENEARLDDWLEGFSRFDQFAHEPHRDKDENDRSAFSRRTVAL